MNMNPEDTVEKRIRRILESQFGEDDVNLENKLVDDLDFNSLDEAEFIMHLEKEFQISIPDNQAEKINTLNDAIRYCERYVKVTS